MPLIGLVLVLVAPLMMDGVAAAREGAVSARNGSWPRRRADARGGAEQQPESASRGTPSYIIATLSANMTDGPAWQRTCGGCAVLHGLADRLEAMGRHVHRLPWGGTEAPKQLGASKRCGRARRQLPGGTSSAAVVIYPEILRWSCPGPKIVHVRWVLAPLGSTVNDNTTDYWGRQDLVFNYGGALKYPLLHMSNFSLLSFSAVDYPVSNVMQILLNPYDSDGFDGEQYPPLRRRGKLVMLRKAYTWHSAENLDKALKALKSGNATELTRDSTMADNIHAFRTHKFFVCFDPYSYYAFIAAMLGCVTIVHPLADLTKREWLMSTWLAPWLAHSNATDMPGIAYGWAEARYAEQTMKDTRRELLLAKQFSETTVARFVRDVERAANRRADFEAAMRVADVFPHRWWA